MRACLNSTGIVDSAKDRLNSVVMGGSKAGRQDLRSLVGRKSSAQEESEEANIAAFTSDCEKGSKLDRVGGGQVGG